MESYFNIQKTSEFGRQIQSPLSEMQSFKESHPSLWKSTYDDMIEELENKKLPLY